MPFEILRNDIAKMKVDAIVNTANPHPVIGAGTDSAVHLAAGPKLLEARKKIGDLRPGQSAATRAYDLPARYVLHTVSPAWQGGDRQELALLRQAYDAALELAVKLKCKSVAFPLMAAGSYGFPKDRALAVAIRAFTDFLLTHEMQIYLVIFNGEAFRLAGALFDDLKSYVDDRYVSEQTQKESIAERPHPSEREELREEADYCEAPHGVISSNSAAIAKDIAGLRPWRQSKAKAAAPQAVGSLQDFLNQTESTFTEYLLDLLNECGEKDSAVYHRAQMSRQLFNKIINKKDYQPSKNTAIQLAIGLQLDLNKTQKLLGKAGYALTRSSKSDLVVQYFIQHGEYSIVTINTALYDSDLPLLTR